jgi:hypothetical protein
VAPQAIDLPGTLGRMSVDRNKLYDEVWAEPMTTAKRYEVSSSFLARVRAWLERGWAYAEQLEPLVNATSLPLPFEPEMTRSTSLSCHSRRACHETWAPQRVTPDPLTA